MSLEHEAHTKEISGSSLKLSILLNLGIFLVEVVGGMLSEVLLFSLTLFITLRISSLSFWRFLLCRSPCGDKHLKRPMAIGEQRSWLHSSTL
ncbi:MAG: hypothetical protein ACUVTO_04950 [Candidatus Caldatribacteriaceae bacterium]